MLSKKKLSIIVPIFNEKKFILKLINKIKQTKINSYFEKEIIVVNDGSTDNTDLVLSKIQNIKIINQKNSGKGRAVQNGIKIATGDLILVQDGDLEYYPKDYDKMLLPFKNQSKISVFGSRVLMNKKKYKNFLFPGKHPRQNFGPFFMNIILQNLFKILFKKNITDLLTGYKIYEKKIFKKIKIETNGFETDHEITSKLVRLGYQIIEVPINYNPRTREEGKKINFLDGIKAIYTIIKYKWKQF